jgi:hypothetical protein
MFVSLIYVLLLLLDRSYELNPVSLALFFSFARKGNEMFSTPEFKCAARECSSTLDFIVSSLGPDLDVLFAQLLEMGTGSPGFHQLRPEHWGVFRQALLFALEKRLGDRFDDEQRKAWHKVFDHISGAMIKVLRPSRRASMKY